MTEKSSTAAQSGIGVVLSRSYVIGSVMLWLAYFMGLVIFYALINWMPLLFKEVGLDTQTANLGIGELFLCGYVHALTLRRIANDDDSTSQPLHERLGELV